MDMAQLTCEHCRTIGLTSFSANTFDQYFSSAFNISTYIQYYSLALLTSAVCQVWHVTHRKLDTGGWHVNIAKLSAFEHLFLPILWTSISPQYFTSVQLLTGTSHQWHVTHRKLDTGGWHVNIGKFQLSSIFLWPSFADWLSPQTFCTCKSPATDSHTQFSDLSHKEKSFAQIFSCFESWGQPSKISSVDWNSCYGDKKCLLFCLGHHPLFVESSLLLWWDLRGQIHARVYFARTAGSPFLPV